MQLVIDIPDETYEYWKEHEYEYVIAEAIADGVPLPQKHGRLKDIDAFIEKVKSDREHSAYTRSWTADDVLDALNNSYAPTILDAHCGGAI